MSELERPNPYTGLLPHRGRSQKWGTFLLPLPLQGVDMVAEIWSITPMCSIHRSVLTLLLLALFGPVGGRAADAGPAGWRGDGSGHYPEAAPPLTWSKAADGKTR